jgi:hypothetical protein
MLTILTFGLRSEIHNFTELWMSAINPFCKYAPKNDRLSEQIYNKFRQLAMID